MKQRIEYSTHTQKNEKNFISWRLFGCWSGNMHMVNESEKSLTKSHGIVSSTTCDWPMRNTFQTNEKQYEMYNKSNGGRAKKKKGTRCG